MDKEKKQQQITNHYYELSDACAAILVEARGKGLTKTVYKLCDLADFARKNADSLSEKEWENLEKDMHGIWSDLLKDKSLEELNMGNLKISMDNLLSDYYIKAEEQKIESQTNEAPVVENNGVDSIYITGYDINKYIENARFNKNQDFSDFFGSLYDSFDKEEQERIEKEALEMSDFTDGLIKLEDAVNLEILKTATRKRLASMTPEQISEYEKERQQTSRNSASGVKLDKEGFERAQEQDHKNLEELSDIWVYEQENKPWRTESVEKKNYPIDHYKKALNNLRKFMEEQYSTIITENATREIRGSAR